MIQTLFRQKQGDLFFEILLKVEIRFVSVALGDLYET